MSLMPNFPRYTAAFIHIPCYLGIYSFRQVPLEACFPEYRGGADVKKAAKYILWRFMQTNRAHLNVYPQ